MEPSSNAPSTVRATGAASALIVEDDHDSAEAMSRLLERGGLSVAQAHSLRQARAMIALKRPDLVLLDLSLPDGSGMELCEDAALVAGAEIILITGHASLETSIKALRLGASDYLIKPVATAQLDAILARFRRPARNEARAQTWAELERDGRFGLLVGRAPAMRSVYEQIAKVAPTAVSVLIEGESGTGKELAAQMIHRLSTRSEGTFLPVNCSAISPNLMESELFGHEKGSFTGAERQHKGYFERARGGTLFLDEITEMPPALQSKLLRVLESGTYMRVGSTTVQQADVRVVAATNRDPLQAVAEGALREDLYYRLSVFPIVMPPLRTRRDDIPDLARHFVEQISQSEGRSRALSASAMERLRLGAWPGNVRELRNAVYRAYVMAAADVVDDSDLAIRLPRVRTVDDAAMLQFPVGSRLDDVERQLILATYAALGQNKERTAATLGVSLKTLYNRLRDYRNAADEAGEGARQ